MDALAVSLIGMLALTGNTMYVTVEEMQQRLYGGLNPQVGNNFSKPGLKRVEAMALCRSTMEMPDDIYQWMIERKKAIQTKKSEMAAELI